MSPFRIHVAVRVACGVLPLLIASAAASSPSPPADRTLDRLLAPIATADSVVVQSAFTDRGVRYFVDGRAVPVPMRSGDVHVGHEWATHFVQALGGGAYHALSWAEAKAWRADTTASEWRVHVRPVGDRAAGVELIPGRDAAIVRSGGEPRAYVEVSQVSDRLLELVDAALPRDSSRARSRAHVPSVTREPLRKLPVEPLPRDRLPAFGEYVYVDELPEAIEKTPPAYPDPARRAGIDGTVLVQALVGADGGVKDMRITHSIPALDDAAVESVRQWRFTPARAAGRPVAVWVAIPVKFSLH